AGGGRAFVWDAIKGTKRYEVGLNEISAVQFSPDGKALLVSYGVRPTGRALFDTATEKVIKPPAPVKTGFIFTGNVLAGFAPGPNGQTLFQAIEGGAMVLRDFTTGKEVARFTYRPGGVGQMSYSPDGKYAGGFGDWGELRLW